MQERQYSIEPWDEHSNSPLLSNPVSGMNSKLSPLIPSTILSLVPQWELSPSTEAKTYSQEAFPSLFSPLATSLDTRGLSCRETESPHRDQAQTLPKA